MALIVRATPHPTISHYSQSRSQLRIDFSHCCAYCGIGEKENGSASNFHIEHYRPRAKFKNLAHSYPNLLYACSHCNLAKGNAWHQGNPATDRMGFLDPCSHDYSQFFGEQANGTLLPLAGCAGYMIERLSLNSDFLRELRESRHLSLVARQCIGSILGRLAALRELASPNEAKAITVAEASAHALAAFLDDAEKARLGAASQR